MCFRTKVSVSWTIDQWGCNRVVDYKMQRVDQSCGAASPCFKPLNPIKRDATKKKKIMFFQNFHSVNAITVTDTKIA